MNNNISVNVFLLKAAPHENFGEYLCKKILDAMGVKCNHYSQANPPPHNVGHIITGIGGFLNNMMGISPVARPPQPETHQSAYINTKFKRLFN